MPYLGLTSFLLRDYIHADDAEEGVNALSRAHVISTLFLVGKFNNVKECQCPISGSRHFYKYRAKKVLIISTCVNALSRAHVISTDGIDYYFMTHEECQCPISGSRHFYGRSSLLQGEISPCQCPISGSRHFYASAEDVLNDTDMNVSMPYLGLTSFLPHPSKLLDSMRVSSSVSAHICQNILKYCYFSTSYLAFNSSATIFIFYSYLK